MNQEEMQKEIESARASAQQYRERLFSQGRRCKWCNEPITYTDTVYIHNWGRWPGDNGYFCNQEKKHHAESRKNEQL